jgi:signal transduction histidine kinase
VDLSAAGDWDHIVEMKGMPPRYIRCRGKVLTTDAFGQAAEHVAAYTEITEEVAVKKERDAFLSLIAHEFRTPITIIVGLADWLTQSGEDLDPQVAHNIRVIWRESDRLGRLIREIWTVAQMQDPDFAIKLEPVDMVALVQEELEMQERLSPGRSWRYTGLSHSMVSGHQELLLLIVQILLSNAHRFSPVEHPIDIELVDEGDMVRLAVADRGPGISHAVARELFHRVPDSLHRPASGGIGLGLYLSKRILDKMGGSITYETRPNGGSVFLVRLPRAFSE